MIDIFILNFDGENLLRRAMSKVCWNRWAMESGCCLIGLKDDTIKSKKKAEHISRSSIYVIADNDCLILGERFVEKGLEIMGRHPEYGLLAATSICDGLYPNGLLGNREEVVPSQAGGVAFVRKGILTEFNLCQPDHVDDIICSEINRKGFKTGYMTGLRFNHIGAGYSITSPLWWMKVPT